MCTCLHTRVYTYPYNTYRRRSRGFSSGPTDSREQVEIPRASVRGVPRAFCQDHPLPAALPSGGPAALLSSGLCSHERLSSHCLANTVGSFDTREGATKRKKEEKEDLHSLLRRNKTTSRFQKQRDREREEEEKNEAEKKRTRKAAGPKKKSLQ